MAADVRLPAQRYGQYYGQTGKAADVPLWAKHQRGRTFAPLSLRCTGLIGDKSTSLAARCTTECKDAGAIDAIDQTFPGDSVKPHW